MKLKQLLPPDWFVVAVIVNVIALWIVAMLAKQSASFPVPL